MRQLRYFDDSTMSDFRSSRSSRHRYVRFREAGVIKRMAETGAKQSIVTALANVRSAALIPKVGLVQIH
jgi:hypothetical protein